MWMVIVRGRQERDYPWDTGGHNPLTRPEFGSESESESEFGISKNAGVNKLGTYKLLVIIIFWLLGPHKHHPMFTVTL